MRMKNPFYAVDLVLLVVFLSFLSGVAVWAFRYTAMVRGVVPTLSF